MHTLAGILVLVLISAEIDGAIRRKTAPHPERKRYEPEAPVLHAVLHSTLKEESSNVQSAQPIELQQASGGVAGMQTQYVSTGAEGYADLGIKLDMRAFLANLQMIPTLGHGIEFMGTQLKSILAYTTNEGAGLGNQIQSLGQELRSRMDREESMIETLVPIFQEINNHITQMDNKIEKLEKDMNYAANGFGGGVQKECANSELEKGMKNVSESLSLFDRAMEEIFNRLMGSIGTLQENMLNSFSALKKDLSVLETISQPGYLCPDRGVSHSEKQMSSSLRSFENVLNTFPQQILSILPQIVGSRNESLQFFNSLTQSSNQIRSDLENVRRQLLADKEDVKRFFAENQKSLVAVKKVVTETTELVQSSAAAAISASRSLKCAVRKQKPDLED